MLLVISVVVKTIDSCSVAIKDDCENKIVTDAHTDQLNEDYEDSNNRNQDQIELTQFVLYNQPQICSKTLSRMFFFMEVG